MSFSAIPVRTNEDDITASFFNLLRTAGIALETFLGAGFISETSFTCANGQGAAANVTGLVFAAASYRTAIVTMEIRRKTDSEERIAAGQVGAIYRTATSAWELIDDGMLPGDETGVTLSITAAGQFQYVSDTMSGANYAGTIKFRAMTFNA